MHHPVTRGQRPMRLTVDIPVAGNEQPTGKKKAKPKKVAALWQARKQWWLLLLLLAGGIVLYRIYLASRSGFGHPLAVPFRLSGNFGELRSHHFHMGLDVRTNGRENLPVYAVAAGYVSRVLIEEYGLGKAVFITHPNGYTTVYAHLNRFYPALAAAVETKQYATKKREQDLAFPPGQFPVNKGALIAWSGNTGGSEAPHLHFEVRDTRTGNNLNPLLYGFAMADDKPPVLQGLYWYNRQYSTYRSAANPITLQGREGAYQAARPVIKVRSPFISLGIRAEDRNNDSRFLLGIYRIECRLDDVLVHTAVLDNFSYADSRYINACVDYPRWMQTGQYIQHLSVLPGNRLPALKGDGILDLSDKRVHRINIRLYDASNNLTTFDNAIQYSGATEEPSPVEPGSRLLLPGKENKVTGHACKVTFPATAFYDTVAFVLKEQPTTGPRKASALVSLHHASIPVHDAYTVALKALPFVTNRLQQKTVVQLNSGKRKYTTKGTWNNNWCTASFNTLGAVQLLIDTIPPAISPVNWQPGQVFTGKDIVLKLFCIDETDGIAGFRAELDGRWLLFERKGNDFRVPIPGHCTPGKHLLTVYPSDEVHLSVAMWLAYISY